ncbi:glycine zipper 2TM domain-containing protein [Sulfurimonas sp. SAG-AH-194-I05]|nr:glycine zipper 2TM domain-containing protein [Sulfurimonas sp. SAG-AH-194-I05]MDF1875100.1 glycine zipper 2TM domain-containing protein [Sulfurimonas sp. SAG-AH-194-I05]
MIKNVLVVGTVAILFLSGCATNTGPEYDGTSYRQIKSVMTGVIVSSRGVVVKDSGSGKVVGGLIGAILGSTMGRGVGTTLASLGGGVAGAYTGNEIGKSDANELVVELKTGRKIVVITTNVHLVPGDVVEIIKDGNKVAQVNKLK